ncbi:N,N'-diacetylbacillosaminyl-diphospho-undecaprenol alpha-1,3-N-acetylgalactosaminyltransferase [Thauera sp. GDN1]|uniref:glycosyltransferase family 4 protein n=1 Tax=Thauera sp. GDN1 TaxID=2944810 RepID=UPI00247AA257|nr:glycosyltransferase family 4 protein [Thauera sp. GDN1]WEN42125.1 N,N'-diacetylbacillosaminyl-diphospho-undecaprenol alpha-1,3-N-acetylgalactosaminyltransferase [Thauera sp. GDN1]
MKLLLFANTEWYLYNFRRSLAAALRDAGHEVLLVSPPGPYGARLQALGFRWIAAPMERRSLNPLRELALVAWLHRLVRAERVDLVHGFTIKCAVYGSLAARCAGRARVNAVAGMGYVFTSADTRARMLRPLVRTLMRVALGGRRSRLILQNPDDVALFDDAGLVRREQMRLIPGSGVDCRRFAPPHVEVVRDAGARLRVLLPARLLWDKGVAEFVEAARLLRAEGRAVEFLLAGDPDPGNPAAVPEPTVRGWVADGVLTWLGHVDDMPALFASVDVVALPSYREGLPKGLIEAGACGLALVTTDAPGCREVVTHEANGLLVPPKDAVALARAIARLEADPGLRKRLGSAARSRALTEFDERHVIARTLAVYKELLS